MTWTLTVRSPDIKPIDYVLKPGVNSLGRRQDNDVVISDEAASRQHAEVHFDAKTNSVTVRDLGSRNGTFVNRRRLTEKLDFKLNPNDVVRIGLYEVLVTLKATSEEEDISVSGLQPFSRELLLESFDNHAVLLYEVMQQLNNILDVDVALKEVSRLLQLTLGADKCAVILAEDFDRLQELGFPRTMAETAIDRRSAVLLPSREPQAQQLLSETARQMRVHTAVCVPVVSGDQTIALIYMYKARSDTRHFSQRDMQLAVAVGHMAALTIERVSLMERVRAENRLRQELQRFIAPVEAEFLLRNYLKTGSFPELTERRCTILFADLVDSIGLAQTLQPKALRELLERYHQDVTDIIFLYGGSLVDSSGSGIMAVFGTGEAQTDAAIKAVSAGVEIARIVDARYRSDNNQIEVGVGIATGPVLAGYVSTKERVELKAIGVAVNVAVELQELAKSNRVLISAETNTEVGTAIAIESQGDVTLGDREMEIFEARTGIATG